MVPVGEEFSAGRFAELAHREIDAALVAGRRPIVVGGTGLYLQAALCELDLRPPPPTALRQRIEAELAAEGPEAVHARLARRAPELAAGIEPGERTRVGRASELLETEEAPAATGEESRLWTAATRHPTLLFGLTMEREALYTRIDARVEELVAAGAAEEVRRAETAGASRTARQALGYEELLRGDVEGMKRNSRRFARRQLTWMRKLRDVRVIDMTARDPAVAAAEIAAARR